jgi:Uncharacterized protein conserved in bacteria
MGDTKKYHIGLDVGSTTVKVVVLNEENDIVFSNYRRHSSDARATLISMVEEVMELFKDTCMTVAMSGSGAMSIASYLGVAHIQEVIAAQDAVEYVVGDVDVVIELGGEDAKLIPMRDNQEPRMNGTCAGGTGAFIDQMAVLLKTDADGLNELAKGYKTIYPIASRCGVFAKTDVQPMINEGVRREDIAASILQAVVTQTIVGLSRGYPIKGKVVFLGGPLTYVSELRTRFRETLELTEEMAVCPENAQLMVAFGAAIGSREDSPVDLSDFTVRLREMPEGDDEKKRLTPLFKNADEYERFKADHAQHDVTIGGVQSYQGKAYLGIDAGSTTMKMVLMAEDKSILGIWYDRNDGDVIASASKMLQEVYGEMSAGCEIAQAVATGYGEQLLIAAFKVDSGEVETVAHLRGANELLPGVEFMLDIGGQDMKVFYVKNGVIENIILNEACSSGCGSFLETYATPLNLTMDEFVEQAVFAENPVDLGSRCTVFMNSRVKQAQKEGVLTSNIAAGLAYSVVKNALYKVINLRDASDLGEIIIVQGGTFLNDAVLRAFELELGRTVVRSNIAGCIGAYGAALIAQDRKKLTDVSNILSRDRLASLKLKGQNVRCKGCSNACRLTISEFSDGDETRKFVAGNRCEKGAGLSAVSNDDVPNLFKYKLEKLVAYRPLEQVFAKRGTVGLPMVLNIYENYPFWFTFFDQLGYRVVASNFSTKETYLAGVESIPSDTACYPAKLTHGHIVELKNKKVDFIFLPCIKWERQEDQATRNHFNCPVVMSYGEVIGLNMDELKNAGITLVNPYIPYDKQDHLARRMYEELKRISPDLTRDEVKAAVEQAWHEDEAHHQDIRDAGERALNWVKETGGHGIVLAGRPYHVDPEVNHGIPELITSFGLAVLTEDSVSHLASPERPLRVADQWMYHSRLYAAARFVASCKYVDLVQLVSFGCGLDAVTTGQVREILANFSRLYTQIKVDEISSLGAAKIRIRSLLAAINK